MLEVSNHYSDVLHGQPATSHCSWFIVRAVVHVMRAFLAPLALTGMQHSVPTHTRMHTGQSESMNSRLLGLTLQTKQL